ncbi:MAG: PocR ligand-binding domain-containing protein [Oscillospiraceae bacterium]|nr:PocR ligand-binding domain-containing protein [Oscillospiraceae bacterium]
MDLNNISLLDVIDRDTLQALQDAFADATGMAALATDDTGAVTELSNPTDFCMNLTRKSREGCERCNKCDLQGGLEASRTGRPSVYYCHGGLVDFAAPIIVNGQHIGSLIGGQVLTEKPDEAKFRKIAREIGVDPDEYVAAVKKVPIVPKKQIDAAANLLYQMANALSETGYQRALAQQQSNRGEKIVSNIDSDFSGINEQMEKAVESMQALSDSFASIKTSAASSAKAVESTDSIIKTIENASTQLTLIGFNASIEAKRAGAAGAGFNVIAQEVRTLADKNTKQAGEIETTLNGIKKAMTDINSQIKAVYSNIEKNQEVIESLRAKLGDVSKMVSEI